jgi:hypothetical protein
MKTGLALLLIALAMLNVACEGCMRRVPVDLVELADWPACARAPADELLVARELASGPTMLEKTVVERYSIARHGDCYVGRVHLSWKLGETALEVVWDRDLQPIAAYKRMGYPGDARLFEERGYRVSESESVMVRAAPDGVERFRLRGERPTVVVPTGRGLFSVAFMRALELSVAESKKETALDLRRLVERIEPASVRRDPGRASVGAGEPPSTFTFMGRDTIFVDEDGFVIGDMAGLETTGAQLSDAFEGVSPSLDAAEAWRRLRAAGLDLR